MPPRPSRPRKRTHPEQAVWDALSAFPQFYPQEQVKVSSYRLDFLCGHVALEVDGEPWHNAIRDGRRDAALHLRGFIVIHLPAKEVMAMSPLALIDHLDMILRMHEYAATLPYRSRTVC